jgi:hypothetical protein
MPDQRSRRLLESLGLSPDDLPETAAPSDEEIRQFVRELLVEGMAQSAANALNDWPTQSLPALRDAFSDSSFLQNVCESEELHRPVKTASGILCKSDPDFVVERIESLATLPECIASDCVELAFEKNATNLVTLLDRLISSDRRLLITSALSGIRKAASQHNLTVDRESALYKRCLSLCSPTYPANYPPDYVLESDPAVFVCQSFGYLAEVDLATKPFFDFDNRHFNEILRWLPSVVSNATSDLVRSEFQRMVAFCEKDLRSQIISERFFPLAALKLGNECRHDVEELLKRNSPAVPPRIQNALTKALAIISCGRDPLDDAYQADIKGGFDSLNEYEQAIMLSHAFDGQVCNGHVFQFLSNTTGERALETCRALATIGDQIGLQLLQSAIDKAMSEVEAETPQQAVRNAQHSQRRRWETQLDDIYRQYCSQEDVTLRIFRFVLEHSGHF